MSRWLVLSGVYLWIGFTVGYFFRKWMERSYLPRYRASVEGPNPPPPRRVEP